MFEEKYKGIKVENKYVTVPTASVMIGATKNTLWKMLKDRRFTRYRQIFDEADHALISVEELMMYKADRDKRKKVTVYSRVYGEIRNTDGGSSSRASAKKESCGGTSLDNQTEEDKAFYEEQARIQRELGPDAEGYENDPEMDYTQEDWYIAFTPEQRVQYDAGREEGKQIKAEIAADKKKREEEREAMANPVPE